MCAHGHNEVSKTIAECARSNNPHRENVYPSLCATTNLLLSSFLATTRSALPTAPPPAVRFFHSILFSVEALGSWCSPPPPFSLSAVRSSPVRRAARLMGTLGELSDSIRISGPTAHSVPGMQAISLSI